jgi:hypothetical protein
MTTGSFIRAISDAATVLLADFDIDSELTTSAMADVDTFAPGKSGVGPD